VARLIPTGARCDHFNEGERDRRSPSDIGWRVVPRVDDDALSLGGNWQGLAMSRTSERQQPGHSCPRFASGRADVKPLRESYLPFFVSAAARYWRARCSCLTASREAWMASTLWPPKSWGAASMY
jgi:hypothetical protein